MILRCIVWIVAALIVFSTAAPRFPLFRNNTNPAKTTSFWTNWETCPEGTFIFGMSILTPCISVGRVKETMKGIRLFCNDPTVTESRNTSIADYISATFSTTFDALRFSAPKTCQSDEGQVVGLQLKVATGYNFGNNAQEQKQLQGVSSLMLYCDNLDEMSNVDDMQVSSYSTGTWKDPVICAWGECISSVQAQFSGEGLDQMTDIKIKCEPCAPDSHGWKDYREVDGQVIESMAYEHRNGLVAIGRLYDHHFKTTLDIPYYYLWKFCPESTYVTGIQLKYGTRGLRFLCADMSRPKPRSTEVIEMPGESTSDMSEEGVCDGVAIGFQVNYHEQYGVKSIRLICSSSKDSDAKLPYIEGRFRNNSNDTAPGVWQEPKLCGRDQAICGFKAFTHALGEYKNLLEHVKIKCCTVPDISEICIPTDKYELLVECDATEALADTTCTYAQTEGMSISHSRTESEKRDEVFHKALTREWTITEGTTERESEGTSTGQTESDSTSNSKTSSQNIGESSANMDSEVQGQSTGRTSTHTKAQGQSLGLGTTRSQNRGTDQTQGSSQGFTYGNTSGRSGSAMRGSNMGSSSSQSSTKSHGWSESDSKSDTEGISSGFMKARMLGNSQGQSSSDMEGTSSSSTRGTSKSQTRGSSTSDTSSQDWSVSSSAGGSFFFVSASVETNFRQASSSTTARSLEQSESESNSNTNERSNQRTRSQTLETSKQETEQNTGEQSKSSSSTKTHDSRSDISNLSGQERNQQESYQETSEINSQKTASEQTDRSLTVVNRISTDDSSNTNKNINTDESFGENVQQASEVSNTRQKTKSKETSDSTSNTLSQERGFQSTRGGTTDRGSEASRSNSKSQNSNAGKSFTTGFDWSRSSSSTFNLERRTEVTMTVPFGMRTKLYQVVGQCAHYTVRTTKYKRVDYSVLPPKMSQPDIDYETEELDGKIIGKLSKLI